MTPYIQKFIDAMSPNTCWEIYPEHIKGFTDKEIDIYTQALNIEAHGDFRIWLATFAKCSGGFFISDEFFLFKKYNDYPIQKALSIHSEINIAWQKDMFEEGFITNEELNSKPYFITRENETSYYFIYTTDPELLVWHYCDGDDTFECTNLKFVDYLSRLLSQIQCKQGVWLDKFEVLEASTSNIFPLSKQ